MLESLQPQDVKKYTKSQLNVLCDELRNVIYKTVNECGGHLASNLGSVESVLAMFYVFDFPHDKVIFDVGHQCYPYKLLSGRYDKFSTLRQSGGISGFPKRTESIYDCYDTGHAGTSVSAALGIAKASDLKGEKRCVIAYIGDGSFNNGLIYEALCSLKILNTKILIVLNDNGMSISPTVGGMYDIIQKLHSEKAEGIKLLEQFGLKYIGVKNGNDVEEMIDAMTEAKTELENSAVLLHIVTKKGKGYEFSEEHPENTHGISPVGALKNREYSEVLGETLCEMAKLNPHIAVVSAAMTGPLGLDNFFNLYPERAFDVGICEENASVLCAGMASQGLKPYYAIYSTFLQRAFDEIIHDVCAQDLPVTFCLDRAGISGADGETHQGVFDLSYLSLIPNLTIAAPKDTEEYKKMLLFSERYNHPLAIRYPRAGAVVFVGNDEPIVPGKWEYLNQTEDGEAKVTVLASGERCLVLAMKILKELQAQGKNFDVVNARFVKPLDVKLLEKINGTIVTIEDNVAYGGFGNMVASYIMQSGKKNMVKVFAYKDAFIRHGGVAELQKEYGVDSEQIQAYIAGVLQ